MIDKYYLESTGDHTDRTAEITDKLKEYGVCLLGAGLYVVNGVDMPEGSTLSGLGNATRLLLDPEAPEGYAVKLSGFCTVKDLAVLGSEAPIDLPEEVGCRHGLLYRGTATRKDWQTGQPFNAKISGCFITSFTGGGITGRETGYHLRACMAVSDCHIVNCGAGINLEYLSEYHKFSNVICNENLYGCINNGGNNVFVGCAFDGNETGFVIDNREGKSPNNSHGSVVGCTFNHMGQNKGIGLLLLNVQHGYVFTGCQMFYSKIISENSAGIILSDFNFGRDQVISVKGEKPMKLSNCMFAAPPIISLEDGGRIIFDGCIDRAGNSITA